MLNKETIHRDLKPKNILISLDRLDKYLINLSDYVQVNLNQLNSNSFSINGIILTLAPEILKDEKELTNSKSDI